MRSGGIVVDLSETDDASANTRMDMHLRSKAVEQCGSGLAVKAHLVCRLHQQQLIEVLLLSLPGSWLLSRLFSFTLFLRNAGVFMRLLTEVRKIVRDEVMVISGPPPRRRTSVPPGDACLPARELPALQTERRPSRCLLGRWWPVRVGR